MIDAIVGLICMPVSFLLFLNVFGVTHVTKIFGIPVLMIAAIALVINQIANALTSHIEGHNLWVSYLAHTLLFVPALLYFLSLFVPLSTSIVGSLQLILACFIFTEGVYSLFLFT